MTEAMARTNTSHAHNVRDSFPTEQGLIGGEEYRKLEQHILLEMLKDRRPEAREQAAEALSRIGDECAIRPLLDALRRCFVCGKSNLNLTLGTFLILGWLILYALAAISASNGVSYTILAALSYVIMGQAVWQEKRKARRSCEVLVRALEQISRRISAPELHEAIADLKNVTRDVLQQSRATRESARRALEQIDQLAGRLRYLPRSTTPSVASVTGLPRQPDLERASMDTLPTASKTID